MFLPVSGLEVACGPQDVVFRVELVLGPNLIKNGSFEDSATFVSTPDEPIVAPGAKLICGGSASLSNWSVMRVGAKQQDCTPAQTGGASNTVSWFDSPNRDGIAAEDG